MIEAVGPWLADALLVLGVAVMALAVLGVARLPDVYMQLHAASKAAALAIFLIALATIATGEAEIWLKALLVAAFLLITSPISAHAIARAAVERGEPMLGHDAVDESGRGLHKRGRR